MKICDGSGSKSGPQPIQTSDLQPGDVFKTPKTKSFFMVLGRNSYDSLKSRAYSGAGVPVMSFAGHTVTWIDADVEVILLEGCFQVENEVSER